MGKQALRGNASTTSQAPTHTGALGVRLGQLCRERPHLRACSPESCGSCPTEARGGSSGQVEGLLCTQAHTCCRQWRWGKIMEPYQAMPFPEGLLTQTLTAPLLWIVGPRSIAKATWKFQKELFLLKKIIITACMLAMGITELGPSQALGTLCHPHEDPGVQILLFSTCLWWGSRGSGGKCFHVRAHCQHWDGDPVTPGPRS